MTKQGLSQVTQDAVLYWLDIAWRCHIAALRTRDLCVLTGVVYHPHRASSMRVTLHWLARQGCVRRVKPGWWARVEEGHAG